MSYPPYPPDPNRPQDTPRSFPTYGRPQEPPAPVYGQSAYPQPGQQPPGPWVPPQSAPPKSVPYQSAPYQPGYPPAYGTPPAPYGYGYGYPGFSEQRTNGLAVAALAVGLGSLVFGIAAPVAVGLGIAALVQLKRRPERGTGQAVAGLVVGSLTSLFWAGVLVLMIAVGSDTSDDDYSSRQPTSSGSGTYIDELVVGECFDEAGSEDEVDRMPCDEPHQGELYAVVTLPPQTWPGDKEIGDQSEAACDKAFEPYVGISVDDSELEPVIWYPELSTWSSGDRNVYCGAYGPGGDDLDKTVKNSRR